MGIILKLLSRVLCGGLIGAAIVISVLFLIHGNEAFDIVSLYINITFCNILIIK